MQVHKEFKEALRILVCEDHAVVRDALTVLIGNTPGCTVVGESQNAADALEAVQRLSPNLLVLDLSLPDRSGFDLLRDLKSQFPALPILVFTMHEDSGTVRRLRDAGVSGYVPKSAPTAALVQAMRSIAAGESVFPPQFPAVTGRTARPHDLVSNGDPLDPLSKREREIFYLLIEGLPNRVIAQRLFISPRTIETHRARVIRKLGCCSTADLIRYAIRHSLTSV